MKTAIGMYILDTRIHMAQVAYRMGRSTVERTADCPWDRALLHTQSASIAQDIAATIKREGFNSNVPVIVGLPGDWISYVPLETEAIGNQDMARFLQFEMEDDVPIPFENFEIDMMGTRHTDSKLQGLVAACDRSEKDAMCHVLEQAGLNVKNMCPDLAGLDELAAASSHPKHVPWTLHLHLENRRCLLTLSQEGVISIGRSLRCDTESHESLTKTLTPILREVFGVRLHGVKPEALNVRASLSKTFESAVRNAFTHVWNGPVDMHDTDQSKHANKPSDVAGGLASTYLRGNPMPNFMASQLTHKQLKKEMSLAGGLLALLLLLLLVMWGAGTYSKIKDLQQEQSRLTGEIKAVFTEYLPEVKKIVQPVAQMTNHVESYRKESEFLIQAVKNRALPLRVLQRVSKQVEEESDISITFIDIDSVKVSLEGTAPSYESVESLAEDLRSVPAFKNVQLGDVSGTQTGTQVSFKLSISRGTES